MLYALFHRLLLLAFHTVLYTYKYFYVPYCNDTLKSYLKPYMFSVTPRLSPSSSVATHVLYSRFLHLCLLRYPTASLSLYLLINILQPSQNRQLQRGGRAEYKQSFSRLTSFEMCVVFFHIHALTHVSTEHIQTDGIPDGWIFLPICPQTNTMDEPRSFEHEFFLILTLPTLANCSHETYIVP